MQKITQEKRIELYDKSEQVFKQKMLDDTEYSVKNMLIGQISTTKE